MKWIHDISDGENEWRVEGEQCFLIVWRHENGEWCGSCGVNPPTMCSTRTAAMQAAVAALRKRAERMMADADEFEKAEMPPEEE